MDTYLRAWYGLNEAMHTGYSVHAAVANIALVHRSYCATGLEGELTYFPDVRLL